MRKLTILFVALTLAPMAGCAVAPADEEVGEAQEAIIGPGQPTVMSSGFDLDKNGAPEVYQWDSFPKQTYEAALDGQAYELVADWTYWDSYYQARQVSTSADVALLKVGPDPKDSTRVIVKMTHLLPTAVKVNASRAPYATASIIGPG